MEKIIVDLEILKQLLEKESKKLVGKTMKRFELFEKSKQTFSIAEVMEIKNQTKEIEYEWTRDLIDAIVYLCKGQEAIKLLFDKK